MLDGGDLLTFSVDFEPGTNFIDFGVLIDNQFSLDSVRLENEGGTIFTLNTEFFTQDYSTDVGQLSIQTATPPGV